MHSHYLLRGRGKTQMNSYLYANPSFIAGMASILDLAGTLVEYNYSDSGEQADFIAFLSDWVALGGDMRGAVEALERELQISVQIAKEATATK